MPLGGPVPLRDASLKISVAPGAVEAPLEVIFAEVPFQGELNLTDTEIDLITAGVLQIGDAGGDRSGVNAQDRGALLGEGQ